MVYASIPGWHFGSIRSSFGLSGQSWAAVLVSWRAIRRSLIRRMSNKGPNIEPWETTVFIGSVSDSLPL